MKRLAAVILVGLSIVPATTTAAQEGARITERGWWTRRPGAAAKTQGWTEVAYAPDGAVSVAAYRISLGGRVSRLVLALDENGGVNTDVASIAACPAAGGWSPANPGAWDARPRAACDRVAVNLGRDGDQWRADITALTAGAGDVLDVVLVPAPEQAGVAQLGFQVEFAAAFAAAEHAPSATPMPSPSSGATGTGTFDGGFGLGAPPVPAPAPPAAAGPVPSGGSELFGAPAPGAPANAPGSFPVRGSAAPATSGDDRPWGRLGWIVPLAAVLGAIAAFARRTARLRGMGLPGSS